MNPAADDPKPPPLLYKYLLPERIDILENQKVRFSKPVEFNDIFDSQFLVARSLGQKAVYKRAQLRAGLGVFCLAKRPNNHRMWVDYAKRHTGFVLGFDAHARFFSEDGRQLLPVRYQDRPDVVDSIDVNACLKKSKIWQYEDEWRCIRSFNESESRDVAIEPTVIKQVIFGMQMKPSDKVRILQFCTWSGIFDHLQFFSTKASKDWSIEVVPKAYTVCPTCDGDGFVLADSTS